MRDVLRLSPARLPIFVIAAAVLATILDAIGFIVVMAVSEESASEQLATPGRALGFMSRALGRVGPSFTIGVVAFVVAFLIARRIDDSPGPRWGREQRRTSSPAAFIAGVLAIIGGGYAVLSVSVNVLPWTQAIAESDAPGRPAEWVVSLIIVGLTVPSYILAAIPLVLGLLVVRRVMWARYALLIFFVLLAAGLIAWTIGPEASIANTEWPDRRQASEPSASDVVNGFIAVPVAILKNDLPFFATGMILAGGALVWATLRERGSVGSFRECWRALIAIAVHVPYLAAVVFLQMYDMIQPQEEIGEILGLAAFGQSIGIVVMMFVALWALAKDENRFWARLNAWLVDCAPLVISGLGLIASIFQAASLALAG